MTNFTRTNRINQSREYSNVAPTTITAVWDAAAVRVDHPNLTFDDTFRVLRIPPHTTIISIALEIQAPDTTTDNVRYYIGNTWDDTTFFAGLALTTDTELAGIIPESHGFYGDAEQFITLRLVGGPMTDLRLHIGAMILEHNPNGGFHTMPNTTFSEDTA